jgi:hypothetical protein
MKYAVQRIHDDERAADNGSSEPSRNENPQVQLSTSRSSEGNRLNGRRPRVTTTVSGISLTNNREQHADFHTVDNNGGR